MACDDFAAGLECVPKTPDTEENGGSFAAPVLIIRISTYHQYRTRQGAQYYPNSCQGIRNLATAKQHRYSLIYHTVDAFRVG